MTYEDHSHSCRDCDGGIYCYSVPQTVSLVYFGYCPNFDGSCDDCHKKEKLAGL